MTARPKEFVVIHRCAHCMKEQDRAMAVERGAKPAPPDDGDCIICMDCGGISIIEAGRVRKASSSEMAELKCSPDFVKARAAVAAVIFERRRH